MADDSLMSQEEIERLLAQTAANRPTPDPQAAPPSAPQASAAPSAAGPAATAVPPTVAAPIAAATSRAAVSAPSAVSSAAAASSAAPSASDESLSQEDIEFLLNQAERALASIDSPNEVPPGVTSFRLPEFTPAPPSTEAATIELVSDIELDLRIELGRTHMYLEDVLRLRKGSVVPLDKLAGDPVDIFVNGRLIARGEVLVLNDNFCVRVAELLAAMPA